MIIYAVLIGTPFYVINVILLTLLFSIHYTTIVIENNIPVKQTLYNIIKIYLYTRIIT